MHRLELRLRVVYFLILCLFLNSILYILFAMARFWFLYKKDL